jgi:hypothetical protein
MKPKTAHGKSPKGPITKEVFPQDMERKKMTGTVLHKPTSASIAKRRTGHENKDLMATGIMVKTTPKTGSKKVPLSTKENLSANRTRTKKPMVPKYGSKAGITEMKLHKKSAVKIQRWWRNILNEREQLRQKLISARQALNELKKKRDDRKSLKSSVKTTEQNTSVQEVQRTEEVKCEIEVIEEQKNVDILETACFGKFNIPKEFASESR